MPRGTALKSGKNLYIVHAYQDNTPPVNWRNLNTLRICSIDMGRVNFGMEIETRRWRNNRLYLKRDMIAKYNLGTAPTNGISHFYRNITNVINEHHDLLVDCRLVLIEKQLSVVGTGKGGNSKTYRDSQHLITMFQNFPFKYPCHIVEVSPKVKTKYLSCPNSITGKSIKKWCENKAEDLIELSDDELGKEALKSIKAKGDKLDEIGDIICQAEAFMELVAIDTKDRRFCMDK